MYRTRQLLNMRAVQVSQFGGPEVCKVSECCKLPELFPTQVQIKVEVAGVNPVDTYIRSGWYPVKPHLPYIPGSDCSGRITAVGTSVTRYKVNDPVFTVRTTSGAYAESTVAEEQHVFPLIIDKLSFEQGASLGIPFFTAYRAIVKRGQGKAGEKVLIHGGSGGVGTICIQIGKHLGMEVYATGSTTAGQKIMRECGADHIFNHKETDYCQKMMEATGNEGFDLIIEMLADKNLQHDLEMVRVHGRIVIVGSRGNIPDLAPRFIMAKECHVMGVLLFKSPPEDWVEMGKAVLEYQNNGVVSPAIHKVYKLEEAGQAHIDIIDGKGAAGSLVIKP